MLIPGRLIGLLTFPGVIVHELGHLLLCKIAGVKVKGWCLFRVNKPQGFVIHEKTESVFKNFLITFGPFFVNSVLTILLALIYILVKNAFPFNIFFLWLAISVGAHSFPSTGDGKNLWNSMIESLKRKRIWNAVFLPFVAFIYIGALLSFFWIDFIYAGFLVFGTQAVFSDPIDFSGGGMSHRFENDIISFNYPWNMQQTTGEEYSHVKSSLKESEYELYLLISQPNGAVAVFGAERGPEDVNLEILRAVIEVLEYPGTYSLQKNELVKINGREWYEINSIDSEDPKAKLYMIEGRTLCPKHIITVKVFWNNYFNHALFEQITKSFECKEVQGELILSVEEFKEKAKQKLLEMYPGSIVSDYKGPKISVGLKLQYEDKERYFGLFNAYNKYLEKLEYLNEILEQYLASIPSEFEEDIKNFDGVKEKIFPKIMGTTFLEGMREDMIPYYENVTESLIKTFVLDYDKGMIFLREDLLEDWNKTSQEIEEVAFGNLRKNADKIINQSSFQRNANRLMGSELASSIILDSQTFTHVTNRFGIEVNLPVLIGLPTRERLWIFDKSFGEESARRTIERNYNAATYKISDKVFELNEKWELIELN